MDKNFKFMNITQEQIVSILHKSDWVTAKEFKMKIKIEPRQLRKEVAELRKQGLIIESGNDGYSIAKTQKDAERCITRRRRRTTKFNNIV